MVQRCIYLLLIIPFSLFGFDPVVILQENDQSEVLKLTPDGIESFIQNELARLASSGFTEASILPEMNSRGDTLNLRLERGDRAGVKHLHFPSMSRAAAAHYRQGILNFGDELSYPDIQHAVKWLDRRGILGLTRPELTKDELGDLHLSFPGAVAPEIRVDALAAFNQSAGVDTVSWFGEVNVTVPNLLDSGKRLELFWKRLKTDSELMRFSYSHPQLIVPLLTGRYAFRRDVTDGEFQRIDHAFALDYMFSLSNRLGFLMEDRTSIATLAGSENHPEWNLGKRRFVGLEYEHVWFSQNGSQGFELRSSLLSELSAEPGSLTQLDLRSQANISAGENLYLEQRHAMQIQDRWSEQTDPSFQVWLGGTGSVRGFSEDHTRANSYLLAQTDLGWRFSPGTAVFMFLDITAYEQTGGTDVLRGYGAGIEMNGSTRPLRITLATHPGLGLANAFLHIEMIGIKRWIDRS